MATKIEVWREAARLLGDYRLAALTDDSAQRYAFDDAWDRTVRYVLRSAFWKFALKTVPLDEVSVTDALPGYDYVYDLPCDWLRTHAIYIINTGNPQECPIDCKHTLEQVHSNVATPWIRYISDDYADPDTWPEHFAHSVACRLAFETAERITGNPAKTEQALAAWTRAATAALGPDALPENPWLRFQLDGSMLYSARWLLDQAYWRFAVKTVTLNAERGAELLANGGLDADASWTKGTGWTILGGTARHAAGSAASLSQAITVTAAGEYEVIYTISEYVAGTATIQLTGGGTVAGTARSADGTYTETLTAVSGNTTFGIAASAAGDFRVDDISVRQIIAAPATVSPGYTYKVAKPADFGRTFHYYTALGPQGWVDIDFRDEEDYLHSQYEDTVLRYVSTDGEDSLAWSDGFRRALLAYLEFEEAKRNPQSPGGLMQAKSMAWQDAFKNARIKDDLSERPRLHDSGRLAAARSSRTGGGRIKLYAGGWG